MSEGSRPTPSSSSFLPLVPSITKSLVPKPSWIGRIPAPRSATPGIPVMKQEVRISYRSKGLRAPVYIVASITEPQWTPLELHSTVQGDGELEFWRTFEVEEGEYQYKFRLGPGEWWALDESKPMVDDGLGNRNNTITVEAPKPSLPQRPSSTQAPEESAAEHILRSSSEQPRPSLQQDKAVTDLSNPLRISHAEPEGRFEPRISDDKVKQQTTLLGPTAPLTPPMTPEMGDRIAGEGGQFQPFPVAEIQRPASVASHYSDKSVEEGLAGEPEKKEIITIRPQGPTPEQKTGMIAAVKYFLITLGTWIINMFGGGMRATGLLAVVVGLAAIIYKIRDLKDAVIPAILSILYPSSYGRRNGTDGPSMV